MREQGRHRLGAPGLVHCARYPAVAERLAEIRGASWWAPSRHTLAGLRRRAALAAAERAWAPTVRPLRAA